MASGMGTNVAQFATIGKGCRREKWNYLQPCGQQEPADVQPESGNGLVFRGLFRGDALLGIPSFGRVAHDDMELHGQQFAGQKIERRAPDRGTERGYVVDRKQEAAFIFAVLLERDLQCFRQSTRLEPSGAARGFDSINILSDFRATYHGKHVPHYSGVLQVIPR